MSKSKELTYPERAGLAVKELRETCVEAARLKWEDAKKDAGEIVELKVGILNKLRLAGNDFNEASGRGQLTFTDNGNQFCRLEIVPLTNGMTLQQIKLCCHLANTIKEPIRTREELALYEAELEPFFNATFGLSKKPRELHAAEVRNWFSTLVSKAADFRSLFAEIRKQQPMETWGKDKLEEFIETTKPVEDERNAAKKRLAELEGGK